MNPSAIDNIRAACKAGTSNQQRAHVVRHGKWMVVTEEGTGNIRFYPFETEAESCQVFRKWWCSRVRLDPSGASLTIHDINT